MRGNAYSSEVWNIVECVMLFAFVLMHEFGHALACRQVGGKADEIVLWPLGGVAYVSPPPRPGAVLWSITAGPLVNLILLPIFYYSIPYVPAGDLRVLVSAGFLINQVLLIFNLLPVYPLDGGQILRALLWFVMGRATSLMVAVVIGFIGVAGLFFVAWNIGSLWIGILSFFILMSCWSGFQQARALMQLAKAPRRSGFGCPTCRSSPLRGEYWACGQCRQPLDIFEHHAVCPHCGSQFGSVRCVECGREHSIDEWAATGTTTITRA